MEIKIRDNREKEWFWLDNEYLNGYAKYLGTSCTVVYLSLCRHAKNETQSCFPSIESIAEENGIHKSTVIKAIKKLEEWNIIYVERCKNKITGRQEKNIYYLRNKNCWKAKPSSINEPGNRVVLNSEPGSFKLKTRVAQSDHNNTNINNTNINNTLEPSAQVCEDITYVPLEEEIKGLKKQPIVKDPKVEERKAIIGYFIRKSKEIHGYCPQISLVPTLKLIKTLQSFNSEVDLRELIDWFLQSDLYDNLGSDIKICFSLASYNKFMDYKRKH